MTPKPAAQLVLDLGHRPAFGLDDFLVADPNREAVAWLDRWPDWPAPALALYGPAGSGKSHLAEVWRSRSRALGFRPSDLEVARVPELAHAGAVVLDPMEGAFEERALLHLYNTLAERRGHLLLVAREPPSRWPVGLADLKSRLGALPAVAVGAPDDTLLAAVMVKLFNDRQLHVEAELVRYLLLRLERSFAAIRAAVASLDQSALEQQRPVNVALAREMLGRLQGP
ncbi:MAG: DNA replication protein [Proteobacteria bacterium]|nr:DNA replication protein [Pseudomonadota bacterium]MBI3495820.1 DNA replication protein [Pseudomonadota bacterium]